MMTNILNAAQLCETAKALVGHGKGILTADESASTLAKRFGYTGHTGCTEEKRKEYRQLLFTTKGMERYISGVIVAEESFNETAHPTHAHSKPHRLVETLEERGILIGIKVDKGIHQLAGGYEGETYTDGIHDLRPRITQFREGGASFARWRTAFYIRDSNGNTPSWEAIDCNAKLIAKFAAHCQEGGLVPIIEPEVVMDGDFSIEVAAKATERVLNAVYMALLQHNVMLEGTLLSVNIVCSGNEAPIQASADEIAYATIDVLARCVPANVPGICFLSGGMSEVQATDALNRMNLLAHKVLETGCILPWKLSFSFGRALQQSCLHAWAGKDENVNSAQALLLLRAHCSSLATQGQYQPSEELISTTKGTEGGEEEGRSGRHRMGLGLLRREQEREEKEEESDRALKERPGWNASTLVGDDQGGEVTDKVAWNGSTLIERKGTQESSGILHNVEECPRRGQP